MALDDGADRSNRSSLGRLEPPAVGVTGDEPAHGTNGAPNLRSDVPSRQSMGWPTGREPHGHGVSVVIRAGESPAPGEGRQVTRCHGTGGARDAKRRNDPWIVGPPCDGFTSRNRKEEVPDHSGFPPGRTSCCKTWSAPSWRRTTNRGSPTTPTASGRDAAATPRWRGSRRHGPGRSGSSKVTYVGALTTSGMRP